MYVNSFIRRIVRTQRGNFFNWCICRASTTGNRGHVGEGDIEFDECEEILTDEQAQEVCQILKDNSFEKNEQLIQEEMALEEAIESTKRQQAAAAERQGSREQWAPTAADAEELASPVSVPFMRSVFPAFTQHGYLNTMISICMVV